MSGIKAGSGSGTKNERRQAARVKARQQREQQRRRARRNRVVMQAAVGAVIVTVVLVVTLVLTTSTPPPSQGPRNMASGGITFAGAAFTAERTPALAAGATPTPLSPVRGKALIQLWEDFGCPACQAFEQSNAEQIRQLVTSGAAEVEYLPVAILDFHFDDDYSTRAANAAAAVANWSPDSYAAFHALLYRSDVQPEEGGPGLSDARLVQLARQAGADHLAEIREAVRIRRYSGWVTDRTDDFDHERGALRDVRFPADRRDPTTPTVLVDGRYFDPRVSSFGSFFTSTAGTSR